MFILKFKKAIDEITHFDSEPRFNRSNEINHHIFGSEEYLNSEIQNKSMNELMGLRIIKH